MSEAILHLERHLKAAQSRRPGWAVGLWGEAGVGKTFTVQALLAQSGIKSLSLHSGISEKSLAQHIPHPPKLPLWAEHILERLTTDQPVNSQALLDALLAVLSQLAPFVVHLEDLHEVGEGRLEFIQNLAKAITRIKGVGLIVTSRSEPPEAFKGYRLGPLSKPNSDALLEAKAQGKLPVEGIEYVFSKAQGNALFTAEFWRYLTRQGFFWSDGQSWQWRRPPDDFVPVSIEALISTMLSDTVDEHARRVLEARAVLGDAEFKPFDAIWAEVADTSLEQLAQAQASLETKGILRGQQFVHPLFREVTLSNTAVQHRQSYARRALPILQTHHPEQAAALIETAQLDRCQALKIIEAALHMAEAKDDKAQVARWSARMVEYVEPAKRSAQALQAARALIPYDLIQSVALAKVAAAESDPEAVIFLAEVLARQGKTQAAEATLTNLNPDPATEPIRWRTRIFVKHLHGKREEVVRLWEAHPEFHAGVDTFTYSNVCFALNYLGRHEEAEQFVQQMLTREGSTPKDFYSAINLRGITYNQQGNLEAANESFRQALDYARSFQMPNLVAEALRNYAINCRHLNRFEEAKTALREALDLCAQLGHTRFYFETQDSLARILVEEGRFEEAEPLLEQGQTVYARYETLRPRCENHLDLASLYLDWQPAHAVPLALRHARAGLGYAREMATPPMLGRALFCNACAEALGKNPQGALRFAEESQTLAQLHPSEIGRSWFTWGVALEANEKTEEAYQAFLRSYEAEVQNGRKKSAERVGLEADRIREDVAGARQRYAWFVEQGLLGYAHIAQRYFPELNQASSVPEPIKVNEPALQLNVLGTPSLLQNGQPLTYRGKKRLEILCYLLEARISGKDEVGLLELLDTFYPEMPEDKAKLTLRQQIYLIRNDLGSESILSTAGGYTLGSIHSDAETFLQSNQSKLWSGPYLHRLTDGWNANVRDGLELALHSCAEGLLETDATEAARLALIWLEMEPYDLEALHLCVRALNRDNPKAAARTYQQARERMLEVGEELPEGLEEFLQTEAWIARR